MAKSKMVSFRKAGYVKRLDKQTLEWVRGNPIHNKIDNECCPDFSCCDKSLLAPPEVRQVFYNAYLKDDDKTKSRLLGEFLGKFIETIPDKRVHIAGLETMRQEIE